VTTVHLVRHATNDYVETHRLAGRLPGVFLNEAGRTQAERLGRDSRLVGAAALFSSPLERARETIAPLSTSLGLDVLLMEELHEIDFGRWCGCDYKDLETDNDWRSFNLCRSIKRAPGGESLSDVQCRMLRAIENIRHRHTDDEVVVVSHGDPIKALLCWWMGIPLDLMQRIEIQPASISTAVLNDWGPQVKRLNAETL
jgi:broad specificity phosphatase PhoE